MIFLRFTLYGLVFFVAATWMSLSPHESGRDLVILCLGVGALCAGATGLSSVALVALWRLFRSLTTLPDPQ